MNMKCFNCGQRKMRTIYPKGYVQKKCEVCGHKTTPVKIPEKTDKDIPKTYIDWGLLLS
jgi:uncharacterized protein (DUF983 family)